MALHHGLALYARVLRAMGDGRAVPEYGRGLQVQKTERRCGMIKIPDHELAPEIDRCPCCGMMVCDRHPATGARERRNVRAWASQDHDDDNRLIDAALNWECNSCGCRWLHGQFAEVAK